MKEKIKIKLKYAGPDVDDGSMSVEDIVPALQGFSSSYGKVASTQNIDFQHKMRITGVGKGSFDILLEVSNKLSEVGPLLNNLPEVALGTLILKKIVGVIKIKKHTEKKSYTEKINAKGKTVVINNFKNVKLEIPLDVFQLFKSDALEQDLSKITQPLQDGQIDSTEINVIGQKEKIYEKISLKEKPFFDVDEVIVAKTQKMTLTGILNSLTKTTNKGTFYLNDGTRVTYRLAGKKPEILYPFFIHKGPVRIECIAHLDENLKPSLLDIYKIEAMQTDLLKEIKKK